jgi:hypothetical protein
VWFFLLSCTAKPTLDVNLAAKDLTPPQVVSITPTNGATEVLDKPTIVIAFNEDMDPATLNSSTVTVKTANGSPGIGSYAYDSAQKALSIKIVQSLYLNTAYTITVTSAVKDRAGNAIVPVTSTFTTDVCPKVRNGKPGFDGPITAIAKIGCTLYVGGTFTSVGEAYAYGISLDSLTGKADGFTYQDIDGPVYAAVSDGNGGWYIGGAFTQIGPYTRNRLAHILGNGEISPWNPNANSTVRALAVSGSTLYAGGNFTTIGGQTRNRLAAIGTDGSLQSWNPNANDWVLALAVSGTTVYAGGHFTSIDGTARNYLAAIDIGGTCLTSYSSSCLQPWNPDANYYVYALAVSGSTVYAGGEFTTIGGTTRNRIAAISTGGSLQSWDPNANNWVLALAVSGSTIYAGGNFTNIGGTPRNRLAAIDISNSCLTAYNPTSCLQSWNPNAFDMVRALAVSGSTVYAGGLFTCFGNCPLGTEGVDKWTRNRLAAIDISNSCLTAYNPTSCLQSWNPNANNEVYALAMSGSTVYAGGFFTTIGATTRNRLAAIGTDGSLQSWHPNAGGTVNALAVSGTTVYAGGAFTQMGCNTGCSITGGPFTRNRLAAIGTDGSLLSWNPNADGTVRALAASDTTVYAGGDFTTIGGTTRNRLAAFGTDGSLQAWNPNANNTVNALALSGSTVYAGGQFTSIGGTPRNYLAAIGTDGSLQSWNPNANSTVSALAVSDSTVYAGGLLTTIGCISGCSITGGPFTRNYLAAIGIDGSLLSWNPNANNTVNALALSGSTVYAGGNFTTFGGTTRNRLAAIGTDGSLQSWNPNADNPVGALAASGSTVYAGGPFTSIGGLPSIRIVSINADGSVNW